MEVLADALALVDDRQLLDLLVQPRILDRDPGVPREQLDEPLVRLLNSAAALVGQVQVADRAALERDRDPSSECIGGWFGGNPYESRVGGDVRDPERPTLADDQPKEPMPCGGGPISARAARG